MFITFFIINKEKPFLGHLSDRKWVLFRPNLCGQSHLYKVVFLNADFLFIKFERN